MKALATVKLIEITLVVAIEAYNENHDGVCAMDYLTASHEAEIIGWNERTLIATYKETAQ